MDNLAGLDGNHLFDVWLDWISRLETDGDRVFLSLVAGLGSIDFSRVEAGQD